MLKKYFWVVFLFFAFFAFSENILDYFIGDNDGTITKWGLHNKILWVHIWGVAISLAVWASLSKNFLLANIAATVWLWLIIEIIFACFIIKNENPFLESGSYGEIFKKDSLIGYQLTPLATGNSLKIATPNDTIYQVTYQIDAHSRRLTPNNKETINNYALFFGGSFTFGDGIEGSETLPSLFTKNTNSHNSYNYGMSGCGPHQMYAFLENNLVKPTIKETTGICVYVYIADHVRRLNGSISSMFTYGETHPRYVVENDVIVRKGSQRTGHPALFRHFFEVISKSKVLQYFGVLDKPLTLGDPIENTVKILKGAQDLYAQQFGNDNFYVLIYPGENNSIIPYLDKENVKSIDLSKLFGATEYRLHPKDLHPTEQANNLVAKALIKAIQPNN